MLKLKRIRWQALILLILLFVIILGIIIGSAAANIVPSSYASESSHMRTVAELTPPECAGMALTNLVVATGGITNGSNANDLILGTSGRDNIKGKNGNDCILGGGGNDTIRGGKGDDYLDGGNGNDRCGTKQGTDTVVSCETILN